MRKTLTIAKREILSFFVSPIAYIVITGFTLLAGYFFFNLLGFFNLMVQRYRMMPYGGEAPNLNQWVVEALYQTLIVVLVFLIPFLTMRIIAEEKRRGTFELLVTSPLTVAEIVIGKFLGVAFVILVMMGIVFLFPSLLVLFGDPGPEVPPLLTGLLGMSLCALAFASLSMAVSCFTENQIVAGISGLVLLLILYVIQSPAESIGGTVGEVLTYLSPLTQLKDMLRGVISVSSIVYFLSLIGFGLFLSQRALEAYRWR